MANSYNVHTSVSGAMAILGVGQRLVSKKWNETTKQKAMERHVIIPMECVTVSAGEASEQFKPLIESALMSAAILTLKNEIQERGESCFELPEECFTRARLIETFMGGDTWLDKESLEKLFTISATWKRITARPEFSSNALYKAKANAFKADILKLAAKNISLSVDACDRILAPIDDADLETEFGSFVAKRIGVLRNKAENEAVDYGGL